MKKIVTRLAALAMAFVAGTAMASPPAISGSPDDSPGKKRIGHISRVHAMTRAGLPHETASSLREKSLKASSRYSAVNASLINTLSTTRSRRYMYSIDPSSGTFTIQGGSMEVNASGGGVLVDGKYYCMTRLKVMRNIYTRLHVFNADTWERVRYVQDLPETLNATDVTYDPTTGRVFGCFYDSAGKWSFGTIDYETLTRTTLASCPQLNALAADQQGNLYGIDLDGMLFAVNKFSGQLSEIGSTGIKAIYNEPDWQGTATFDSMSGKILYAAYGTALANPVEADYNGAIWAIDPVTAQAELVISFPACDMLDGMYIPLEALIDEVPAMPTDLSVSFPGGALTGTVSFKMPEKLVGGMNPSGEMDYEVKANGAVVAEGKARAGVAVSRDVTLERGSYCFEVRVSNSEGSSRPATMITFVGVDSPAKPEVSVRYDYTTSRMELSWNPVTATEFGTVLDPSDVTYRVVRYPGQVEVAPALNVCSFSETLTAGMPEGIVYHVEAVASGVVSGTTVTDPIYIGAFTPYYKEEFDHTDGFKYYTVVDADADRLTWIVSPIDRAVVIRWNNDAPDSEHKDDWLMTPGMRMEAGKVYHLTFGERKLYDAETLEVRMGRNPRIEEMTRVLLPAHTVANDRADIREIEITVDADGIYFIGFHATSPRNSGALYISSLSMSEGVASGAPKGVADMSLTPAADRSHSVTVAFTAPSQAMDGSALTAIDGVDVYRDGEKIGTAPASPGATGSYVDNGAHQGVNIYTLRARNGAGSGSPVEQSVFVGWDEPNRAERVRAREIDTYGVVNVTWSAPELDNNNSVLTEEALRYDVFMTSQSPQGVNTAKVGTDIKGTSHTVTVCTPDEQRFVEFSVVAKTEGGDARAVASPDAIPAGKADSTPFVESFRNTRPEHFWGHYNDYTAGCTWYFSDDYTFDLASQDSDNGFMVMEAETAGAQAEIYSSKISLAELQNPAISFYSYNLKGSGDDLNQNTIEVSVYDGNEKKSVKTISMSDYNEDGWQRISVPLTAYAGKDVQVLLKGTIVNFLTIAVDNIRVDETFARNLSAAGMEVPSKVMLDKVFKVTAKVENTGSEKMGAYTLDMYCGDTKIEICQGRAMNAGETQTFEFDCKHDITSDETAEYWFAISCPGDMNPADDTSRRSQVQVCLPNYPVVTTLEASGASGRPSLSWTAPDLTSSEPFEIIEDFESYPAFSATGLWDWTLYDGDRGLIGGIEDANKGEIELPGIPSGSQQSWFTFDGDYEELNFTYRAHSGRQHLATMYCYGVDDKGMGYETQNDDWLISPILATGSEQISFFARGYSYMAPDALEILNTTDASSEPIMAPYRSLGKIDPMPTSWDEYEVELPAGAVRFALRSIGNFGFMLFVDDITFTPACGASMLSVKGYNVYRDGVKVNSSPVAEPLFIDDSASDGVHTYGVTTVYNRGESRMSNLVSTTSAIDGAEAAYMEVRSEGGCIIVTGADGERLSVYASDGRLVFATESAARTVRIPVAAGIYLVKASSATSKVLVR